MHPEPLLRIGSHIALQHLGEPPRIRHRIRLCISRIGEVDRLAKSKHILPFRHPPKARIPAVPRLLSSAPPAPPPKPCKPAPQKKAQTPPAAGSYSCPSTPQPSSQPAPRQINPRAKSSLCRTRFPCRHRTRFTNLVHQCIIQTSNHNHPSGTPSTSDKNSKAPRLPGAPSGRRLPCPAPAPARSSQTLHTAQICLHPQRGTAPSGRTPQADTPNSGMPSLESPSAPGSIVPATPSPGFAHPPTEAAQILSRPTNRSPLQCSARYSLAEPQAARQKYGEPRNSNPMSPRSPWERTCLLEPAHRFSLNVLSRQD